ncbi:hypothetical protein B1756_09670 [Natrarchaeobaculum aegyptiacum]|uniref:Glycosyltransferase RgtA/B/C/D-like domain-containing protein n=2 Tax=Natrarchaeobaculum aegyptiacum TaxID=745377 RepID=A0A2Z2HS01_9EURY|nr:hypothetical protein B1756_09670 [Natrarchaeobaculum aegyptiacum]
MDSCESNWANPPATWANRGGKLLVVLTALWISYVALLPPATEYEVSVFTSRHVAARGLLYAVLVGSGALLFHSALRRSRLWMVATACALVAYAGYFGLPLTRGYVQYAGYGFDVWVHVGLIDDIANRGTISDLQYPATHLLSVSVSQLTGVEVETTTPLIAFWFKVLLVGGVFVFTRAQSRRPALAILTLLAALPIFYSQNRFTLAPWVFGLTLLPILLYAVHEHAIGNQRRAVSTFALVGGAVVIYHPISALFSFVACAVFLAAVFAGRHVRADISTPATRGVGLVFGGFAGLLGWHLYHRTVDGSIRSTALSLVERQPGGSAQTASTATEVGYTIWQLVYYFLVPNWGVLLLYLGIGGVATVYVAVRYFVQSSKATFYEGHVAVHYPVGGVIGVAFMVFDIHAGGVTRAAQYGILVSIFLVGLALWFAARRRNESKVAGVVCLLVLGLVLGGLVFSVSTGYSDNYHMTHAGSDGYDWHLETKDESVVSYGDSMGGDVYPFSYYGYAETRDRANDDMYVSSLELLAPHLGYHETETVGEWLPEDGYVLLRTEDLVWHEAHPEWRHDDLVRITEDDYDRLHQDRTANRIYTNGEVRIGKTRTP